MQRVITMQQPVILLVDDEADLLDVMSLTLQMNLPDYDVRVAENMEDAVAIVETLVSEGRELSLAVVDHVLGGRTGLEFIQLLNYRFPSVPKMMFTGQAPLNVEYRAKEMGAKVLWKPLPLSTLMGEVQQLLSA